MGCHTAPCREARSAMCVSPGRTSLHQDGLGVHPSSDSILLLPVPPDHLPEDLRTWRQWGDRPAAESDTAPPAGPCDQPASARCSESLMEPSYTFLSTSDTQQQERDSGQFDQAGERERLRPAVRCSEPRLQPWAPEPQHAASWMSFGRGLCTLAPLLKEAAHCSSARFLGVRCG